MPISHLHSPTPLQTSRVGIFIREWTTSIYQVQQGNKIQVQQETKMVRKKNNNNKYNNNNEGTINQTEKVDQ